MVIIPLQAIPNQFVTVTLNNQNCQIAVYQTFFGLFMDVYVSNVLIIAGVICENANLIVRSLYLGFSGDLFWMDTQGSNDPSYTGINTRYFLGYLTATEVQTASQ